MSRLLLLYIVVILLVLACTVPKRSSQAQTFFDAEAHRGGRGIMPENTIPAMLVALNLNVRTLEMDIVITKDKKVLLSHEPFFNHEISTKPDGSSVSEEEEKSLNIYEMTYADVQKFDVGMKPHPRFENQQKIKSTKPLLADVFDSVAQYMHAAKRPYPFFNIETKCKPSTDHIFHPAPGEMVDLLMRVIMEKGMEKQVMIQSFDFRSLQYLRKHYPGIYTAMLIEDYDKLPFEEQLKKLGFTPDVYSPHYSLVTKELVKQCHANKMKLVPWTVNDIQTINQLKALGVDGIISDYPTLF